MKDAKRSSILKDTFGIQRFDFPFDQKSVTKFKEQAMKKSPMSI